MSAAQRLNKRLAASVTVRPLSERRITSSSEASDCLRGWSMTAKRPVKRISHHLKITGDQSTFEFVDVALHTDSPFFLDPRALRSLRSTWGETCVSLLQSFFDAVVGRIANGDHAGARRLLGSLSEPNETHLGLSRGSPAGRGMGKGLAEVMWKALSGSDAATTGLLQDLEDTVLFIDGIGHDRVSDIATNIMRQPLIEFTQDAANYYGIALAKDVATGRCWDSSLQKWQVQYADLPTTEAGPLLLVPKCIVRRRPTFDPGEYLDHHILPILQEDELSAGGALVEVLKDGRRRVTKKSVVKKYGRNKSLARKVTAERPEILAQYRSQSRSRRQPPSHSELAETLNIDPPDWLKLLAAVRDTPTGGGTNADKYHRAVQALLAAVFYPSLVNPKREFEIHDGRKRIDITFTNEDQQGFFSWVHDKVVHAPYVFVECKNYGADIANPEIDQLTGRFSTARGQLGIVCCRSFKKRERWDERCKDTATDGRGYVLTLSDDDLETLVKERMNTTRPREFAPLRAQLEKLLS